MDSSYELELQICNELEKMKREDKGWKIGS